MQVGKFSKINNCADWNKDVQAGIFLEINKLCSTTIRETRVVSNKIETAITYLEV